MSSDSSLGVALVTGASTEIGRAIALRLAKNFDIAINDLPEALKPLEVLKGQIEKEGRKSAIITGDPSIESFWANIGSAIDNRWGLSKAILCGDYSPAGKTQAEVFESLYLPHKWAVEQCSKRCPGAKVVGVLSKIGKGPRCALIFVVVDEDGSVPGAVDPVKSAIRGLTEAAATELSPWDLSVNSCFSGPQVSLSNKTRGLVKDNTIQKVPIQSAATFEAVPDVISFLTSESARFITGHTFDC